MMSEGRTVTRPKGEVIRTDKLMMRGISGLPKYQGHERDTVKVVRRLTVFGP